MVLAVVLVMTACSGKKDPIVIGAIYPLTGSQGPGGVDEYRGARLAIDLINQQGGVDGRPLDLRVIDTPGSDAAGAAVADLAGQGVRFVLGSYGSTISLPAAAAAARLGMLFWETGAVGDMTGSGLGRLVFRVPPTGTSLGRSAVQFITHRLVPLLHRVPSSLRFAVANVNDVYGQAVARGALDEIRAEGLPLAGQFPYDIQHPGYQALVRRMKEARPDVLFVAAYVRDGIALRRETVRQHLRLVTSISTSSRYCMPMFGNTLGAEAVGLFASDKPDADVINPGGLAPGARALLSRANGLYRARYGDDMSEAALAGFSGAWALFRFVMPNATQLTPSGVGQEAERVRLPPGSLPNGSGLAFGAAGTPDAGTNLDAVSVIEEWVGVGHRAVVWPAAYATTRVHVLPIAW